MNQVNLSNPERTMTSREIADLVESRHDSVRRTIERLAESGVIQLPPLVEVKNAQGQSVIEYRIGKRDSYVIVAQLSPAFTARLVDRWQELESNFHIASPFSIPTTLSGALRLAAEQAEVIEQQAAQLAIAAPKAAFVDQYVESSSGSKGFRQVAKLLKANEAEFRAFLQDEKIMYKLGGEWVPYQQHSDAGRFEVKTGTANEHAYTQAKFTAKGVEWVAGEWAKFNVRGAA